MNSDLPTIEALVEDDGDRLIVRAPAVGLYSGAPSPGSPLGPGGRIGRLGRLNRRYVLVLPSSVVGTVDAARSSEHVLAVEYGQILFRLAPVAAGTVGPAHSEASASRSTGDLPDGTYAVISPTDGIFYRRPSPDAPPFVEPGTRVVSGQPVGLVEVMKTFNQIVYGDVGLPERAEVVEVRCEDVEEVQVGQVLLIVRDAS
jgi:acetyl-CoA carboxylase biotin carboxyl carrier protein